MAITYVWGTNIQNKKSQPKTAERVTRHTTHHWEISEEWQWQQMLQMLIHNHLTLIGPGIGQTSCNGFRMWQHISSQKPRNMNVVFRGCYMMT